MTKTKLIKEMLKIWLLKDGFDLSEVNYIKDNNDYNYKVSITMFDKDENIFVSVYNIYISDEEFRITEK